MCLELIIIINVIFLKTNDINSHQTDKRKTCMYGGVTEHNGNQLDKYRSITVRVFEDGKIYYLLTYKLIRKR